MKFVCKAYRYTGRVRGQVVRFGAEISRESGRCRAMAA